MKIKVDLKKLNSMILLGVVIHLGFKQKDGKTHFIDVDLNVPSFRLSIGGRGKVSKAIFEHLKQDFIIFSSNLKHFQLIQAALLLVLQ